MSVLFTKGGSIGAWLGVVALGVGTACAPAPEPDASDENDIVSPAPAKADAPAAEEPAATAPASEEPAPAPAESPDRADPPVEAAPVGAPPTCDVTKPFATPKLVGGVSGVADTSNARLSADELSIFFMRTVGTANNEIVFASRTDRMAAFDQAAPITPINSTSNEGGPTINAASTTMYFHTNRLGGVGGYDIWTSKRGTATVPWGKPTLVKAISSTSTELDPFVRADGRMIVFTSTRNNKQSDLFKATISATGVAGVPVPITELNTAGAAETNPVLSANGLALYFARSGASKDIFVARRKTVTEPFGAATRIEELTTTAHEYPSWISTDECMLYITMESATKKEIYVAERTR